ncbi:unnamed protein product [Ostreobium quekettii]|uniref:protein-serine/threonine phosphatase n=1 Tax=Ostreobium quekettii TaxID=121088 RepID=A0A8S1ITN2_9CHLO|nr:unnamed protein product [Ostreobium quekettii]
MSHQCGQRPPEAFHVLGSKALKGEDVAFVDESIETSACVWKLYCVCDGHGGVGAARFVQEQLITSLRRLLPRGPQPDLDSAEGRQWAEQISSAIAATFVALDEGFAEYRCPSGTTVSLALLSGWLLTVANVGDSEVYLDTGTCVGEMACCHKVEDNKKEQQRLAVAGVRVASLSSTLLGPPLPGEVGVGPLRVWPGGVAVSRSVGDFECGSHVLPVPHIRQVVIPDTGARLLLASDGLWDYFTGLRACKVARGSPLSKVPQRLFKALMFHTDGVLTDDTTILALDILPPGNTDFRHLAKQVRKTSRKKLQSWKDLLSLVTYPLQDTVQEALSFYTDIDAFTHYPRITSRGVAMYRMNKERYAAAWGVPRVVHPVRYGSNMVDLMNDLQLEDGGIGSVEPEGRSGKLVDGDGRRAQPDGQRVEWQLERDVRRPQSGVSQSGGPADAPGRRSPYSVARDRARRITTTRSQQKRTVSKLVSMQFTKSSNALFQDDLNSAIRVDPVGQQDREDIMMTM